MNRFTSGDGIFIGPILSWLLILVLCVLLIAFGSLIVISKVAKTLQMSCYFVDTSALSIRDDDFTKPNLEKQSEAPKGQKPVDRLGGIEPGSVRTEDWSPPRK